ADLIISLNGENYIVEVKSVKKLPKEPFKHHVEQLQFYLAGYGLTQGFLIYLEKSYLKNTIFPVDFNLETLLKGLQSSINT
ncbi:MAG: GxxExxY protein, partial [Candidatus Bathyarchaeia archaeon]